MSSLPNRRYTIDEYFELERTSEIRHEYHNGEIFAMAGASLNHIRIAKRIMNTVDSQFEDENCESFFSDIRVRVNDLRYVYPDVVVVCGEAEMGRGETLLNPTVVFEILSDSTEDYDQNKKFEYYQKIPTLTDHLLVAQDRMHVTHHRREGESWKRYTTTVYTEPEEVVIIESIGCQLLLRVIYERIVFPTPPADQIEE